MPYTTLEQSAFQGMPSELYLFSSDGFDSDYAYTSADEELSHNAIDYIPTPIKRSQPELSKETDAQALSITLPRDNDLAKRWMVFVPPRTVWLTIYRYHRTDGGSPEVVVFWQGKVRAVSWTANEATLECTPIDVAFDRIGLRRTYGSSCGHYLYDSHCKVNINDYRFPATIETVNVDKIVATGFGVFPDSSPVPAGYWVAGFIERDVDGDLRHIIAHGGTGNTEITILTAFENLAIGELVYVHAGCDRLFETCGNKFNNKVNFGGFPFIGENPFERRLV